MMTRNKRKTLLITLTLQIGVCIFSLPLLSTFSGRLSRTCLDNASLVLLFRDCLWELRGVGILSSSTTVVPVLLMVLSFYMREKQYSMRRIVLNGLAPVLLAQIAQGMVVMAWSGAMGSAPHDITLSLISPAVILLGGPVFLAICMFFCVVSVLVADFVGREKPTKKVQNASD